jgi:NADPH:quinone reductase-like Zn-dependent oxidoreductase
VEFVRSLGADRVIDYTVEDFTRDGETYDLIFDILGVSSFSQCKDSLKPKGVYLLASFKTGDILQMLRTSISGEKKVICAMAPDKSGDLPYIKELVEAGAIKASFVTSFPLEEVAEAHRYVESGMAEGPVAITINGIMHAPLRSESQSASSYNQLTDFERSYTCVSDDS